MTIYIDKFEIDRFYSLTEPLLKSLFVNDVASQYPFELSQEELRIIAHFKTPTLVLGRSGTGKTTCLIFKILASYQLNQSRTGEKAFRQVRCLQFSK
jgi:type IV secretory pathway VirB4 component